MALTFPLVRFLNSILSHERTRLILWAPVLIGVGIGWYFGLLREPRPSVGPAAFLLCSALAVALRRKPVWPLALAAALVALGFAAAQLRTHSMQAPLLQEEIKFRHVSGKIDFIDMQDGGKSRLSLDAPVIEDIAPERTPGRIRIALRKHDPALRIGDRVALTATLYPLPAPVAPGAYDFAQSLFFEGYGATGYATSAIDVTEAAPKRSWQEALTQWRLSMASQMLARMQAPAGAVAAALTVGEQNAVPEEVNEVMRDSGLYHILSISGLHLALASGIVFFAVRLLLSLHMGLALRLPVKKIAAVVALLSALFYLLMAGAPVPAQRSFIMVAFVFLAVLFDRKGISIYTLAWAGTFLLLFKPDALVGASFQMSFAATLAIVALYERGAGAWRGRSGSIFRRCAFYVLAVMLTSLAATLATAPLVIYHFSRLQWWGVVSNLLVEPLTAFWIMPGVVLTFLLWPLGLEGAGFWVMETGIRLMLACAEVIARLPYASVLVPSMGKAGLLLCVLGMLWLTLWRTRMHLLGLPLLLIGLSCSLLHIPPDMLVADDLQRVIARGENGQYAMLKGTERSFTTRAWLTHLAQEKTEKLPLTGAVQAACEDDVCHYRARGKHIMLITHWRSAKVACAEAESSQVDAVIALFWLRRDECARTPLRIDRYRLEKYGSYALYLRDGKIRTEDVALLRGKRPWVP